MRVDGASENAFEYNLMRHENLMRLPDFNINPFIGGNCHRGGFGRIAGKSIINPTIHIFR